MLMRTEFYMNHP